MNAFAARDQRLLQLRQMPFAVVGKRRKYVEIVCIRRGRSKVRKVGEGGEEGEEEEQQKRRAQQWAAKLN